MDLLRTPDDRFTDLPDWPFDARYAEVAAGGGGVAAGGGGVAVGGGGVAVGGGGVAVGGAEGDTDDDRVRMAYVDHGPLDGAPVVLLHGEPSWSYLYRHMIPLLAEAGHRVIAPDLVGFGRSDKPTLRDDHTYAAHVEWVRELLLDRLQLTGITLFCQDWGGLIGLRVLAEHPDAFAGAVVANTGLPTGEQQMSEAFVAWQRYSQTVEVFPIGDMLQGASARQLTAAEVAAYDAPFPEESYKAGPRAMPALVPTSPEDPAAAANTAAWASLQRFTKPVVTAFSDGDPITSGGFRPFEKLIPGAAGRPHAITHGGHFLQEDCPEELVVMILALHAG